MKDLSGRILASRFFQLGRLNEKHVRYLNIRKLLQIKGGCLSVIKRLKGKEKRYANDFAHKLSRAIVSFARQFDGCLIADEDLTDIRGNHYSPVFNRRLHQWAFNMTKQFVEYKGRELGLRTLSVYPQGTSKTCSHCGEPKLTRRSGVHFKCKRCDRLDADFNAALT